MFRDGRPMAIELRLVPPLADNRAALDSWLR
jgi:hypothetical protein